MLDSLNDIIKNPFMAYAKHIIILNENGEPIDYEFLEVNDVFEKFTNLKRSQVLNKKLSEVIRDLKPRDYEWIEELGQTALTGKSKELVRYSKLLDKWLKVQIYSTEKYFVTTVFFDITKEKRLNEKIEQNTILENISDIVWVADINMKIVYISPSVKNILGYTQEEYLRLNNQEIYTTSSIEKLNLAYENEIHKESNPDVLKTKNLQLEIDLIKKDKSFFQGELNITFLRDMNQKLIGFQGVTRDVTERNAAEKRFKELFENTPLISVQGYNENRQVIYWNKASEQLYGYKKEDAIGKYLEDLIIPEKDKVFVIENIQNWLKSNEPIPASELMLKKSNGDSVSVFSSHCMLKNINGEKELYCIDIDLQELKDSQQMFKLIAENTSDGLMVYENDNVIYVSPSYAKILGFKQDEYIGQNLKNIINLIHPDDVKNVLDTIYKAQAEKKDSIEYVFRARHKNGTYIWREDRATFIYDDNGKPLRSYVIARNITEKIHTQDYQNMLFKALHQSPSIVLVTDKEGFIEYVNQKFTIVTGYTLDEVKGQKPNILKSDYLSDDIYSDLWNTISSGKVWRGEFHNKKKNGDLYWETAMISPVKNIQGEITNYIALKEDINELKISQEKFKFVSESVNDLIFIYRVKPMKGFEYVSPNCEMLTGYTQQEHYDDPELGFKIVHPDDFKLVENLLDKDNNNKCIITRWIKKDKTVIWTEQRNSYLCDKNGDLITIQGVARDITTIKLAEMEKEKLQTQLMQAQKMESIGRLAGGISHDFNNMLSVISGNIELALLDIDFHNPLYSKLLDVKKATERSSSLTRQLLAFARKQSISPKIINLNTIINDMLKILKRLIGENITLTWIPDNSLWNIKIDPSQLDQVLANLCVNAKDAIFDIGTISIETKNVSIDSNFCKAYIGLNPGDYASIKVKDNGCGMDKKTREQVFEPFFTTKAEGKGTGLGLATVYGIVKQNNGYISVDSELNEGTIFTIYLPKYIGNEENNLDVKSKNEVVKGNETILIVEDDLSILSVAEAILKRLGYQTISSKSPIEVLNTIKNQKHKIDILLTDVVMPEINGKELAEKVKECFPELKTIFMSGYTSDVISVYGVLDEKIHFLQKPFTIQELS